MCETTATNNSTGNGVAIAWWRRALKGGTIKDLNRSWQFSSSVKEIALSGKAFNIIALTALVAKMTIIDSTLLQKSIGTYSQNDPIGMKHNITWGFINETFPSTGAGGSSDNPAGLQPWFNQDLIIWQTGGGVFPNQFYTYDHENGETKNPITKKTKTAKAIEMATMYLNLTGAGFAIVCDPNEDYAETDIDASTLSWFNNPFTGVSSQPDAANYTLYHQQLFGLDFSLHHSDGLVSDAADAWKNNTDYIIMNVVSSTALDKPLGNGTSSCPGTLMTQTCRMRPAKIDYPVQLTQRGNESDWTAVLATDQNSTAFYEYNQTSVLQQNYHTVKEYQNITDGSTMAQTEGIQLGNNTLGGIVAGLNSYLGGQASISRAVSGLGFVLNTTGSAQSYLSNLPDLASSACDYRYYWPLAGGGDLLGTLAPPELGPGNGNAKSRFVDPGVIGNINSIMFALATDVSYMDTENTYEGSYNGFDARIWMNTIHYKSNFWYMGGAIASTIICILFVLPSYWGFWQLGRKVTLGPFEIAAAFRAPNLNHPTAANAPVEKLIEEVGDRRVQFGHIVSGSDAGRIGVAEPEYVERVKPKIGAAGEEIRGRFQQTFARK